LIAVDKQISVKIMCTVLSNRIQIKGN